jgi:hypothetical protein
MTGAGGGQALTPAARRALRLLVENPGLTARRFGLLMWPNSLHHESWQGSEGQGMAKGCVMWLRAGSYLWHLHRRGLAEISPRTAACGRADRWRASELGREAILGREKGGRGVHEGR